MLEIVLRTLEDLFTILVFPGVFFVVLVSLLFEGIDRKIYARMQNRLGPPITQPFYDLIKLFNKERLTPMTASRGLFNAAPFIAFLCAVIGATIPLVDAAGNVLFIGDLILVVYLFLMVKLMILMGGSSSGNPFSAIGTSRMMTLIIGYEVPLVLSILVVAIKAGQTLTISQIALVQIRLNTSFALAYPSAFIAMIVFLLCIPGKVEVVPFDISEAKTEIAYGPLVEYSGYNLALMKISKSILSFGLACLAAILFFTAEISSTGLMGEFLRGGYYYLMALALLLVSLCVPRTINARLKIGQAFSFYWKIGLALSVVSLVLLIIGL